MSTYYSVNYDDDYEYDLMSIEALNEALRYYFASAKNRVEMRYIVQSYNDAIVIYDYAARVIETSNNCRN